MKQLYLTLAIIGAVVPYAFFVQFFASQGFDVSQFVAALFANSPAGGFTVDLLISSFVFWTVMVQQYRRGKGANPVLFIILNLTIGLSCALPAYLYACYDKESAT